jgi:alpha 1,2-mannosyltransferase
LSGPNPKASENVPEEYYVPPETDGNQPITARRANATLLMLARNSDLDNVIRSVRRLEDRFNRQFKYPWIFLNEENFTEEFKLYVNLASLSQRASANDRRFSRVSTLTDAPVHYGLIPHKHWFQPDSIDESRAAEGRKKLEDDNVIYGGSVPFVFCVFILSTMLNALTSYRNMCRFNSGVRIASYLPMSRFTQLPISSSSTTHLCSSTVGTGASSMSLCHFRKQNTMY